MSPSCNSTERKCTTSTQKHRAEIRIRQLPSVGSGNMCLWSACSLYYLAAYNLTINTYMHSSLSLFVHAMAERCPSFIAPRFATLFFQQLQAHCMYVLNVHPITWQRLKGTTTAMAQASVLFDEAFFYDIKLAPAPPYKDALPRETLEKFYTYVIMYIVLY